MAKNRERLVGIKAIADYLNTSPRNIYRWEKDLQLPLRRVTVNTGSRLFAYQDEIEKWLNKKTRKPSSGRQKALKLLALPVGAVVIFMLIYAATKSFNGTTYSENGKIADEEKQPFSSDTTGNTTNILNPRGKKLWSFVSNDDKKDLDWDVYKGISFKDIETDGLTEVLARTYDRKQFAFHLTLFDFKGKKSWETSLTNDQTFNGLLLEKSFFPMQTGFAVGKDGKDYCITYWRHRTRFLSIITRHDLNGKLLNKYLNTGNLGEFQLIDHDYDGTDEIVFTGTNNLLFGEAILGVLRLENFAGVSPPYKVEPEYLSNKGSLSSYVPDDPKKGNQLYYIRFKRTQHRIKYQFEYVSPKVDNYDSGLVQVIYYPWLNPARTSNYGFLYIFDRKFKLKNIVTNPGLFRQFPPYTPNSPFEVSLEELTSIYKEVPMRWEGGQWVKTLELPSPTGAVK